MIIRFNHIAWIPLLLVPFWFNAQCTTPNSIYPFTSNFDGEVNGSTGCSSVVPIAESGWSNLTSDSKDWTTRTGSTPSGSTGPTSDHSGSGYYLYLEASGCYNKSGQLASPCLDLSGLESPELSFWYNMYGANMGSLGVQIINEDLGTWTRAIWSKSGDQGTSWHHATIDLSAYKDYNIRVLFNGITGSAYRSDIAIDDVSIYNTCGSVSSSFPLSSNFNNETTGGQTCSSSATLASSVWHNIGGDDKDWLPKLGATNSGSTGPSSDVSGNGHYLYLEATSCYNKVGYLNSGCLNLSSLSHPKLNFSYHMYGANMGSLSVEVSQDGGNSWSNAGWSKSGDQGNSWHQASVDLSTYSSSSTRIRFKGVTGSGYRSDMALDEISIINEPCYGMVSSFPSIESFDTEVNGSTGCTSSISLHSTLWRNLSTDDKDWTPRTGATPSGGTGPSADHTGGGHYVYTEASSCYSKTSRLQSTCYDFSDLDHASINFWYHMYGSSIGELELKISEDEGYSWTTLWSIRSNRGDEWHNHHQNLDAYVGKQVILQFEGKTLSAYQGDMALDDIVVDGYSELCNLGPDITICNNDLVLEAPVELTPQVEEGTWSVFNQSVPGVVSFSPDEHAQQVTVTFPGVGDYELLWTYFKYNQNGSIIEKCSDRIWVYYKEALALNTIVTDADCAVYPNGSIQVDLAIPTATNKKYILYQGMNNVLIQSTDYISSNTHTFSNLPAGNYLVRVIEEGGCTAQSIEEIQESVQEPEICINKLDCSGGNGTSNVKAFATVYGQVGGTYTYQITENGSSIQQGNGTFNTEEQVAFSYTIGNNYYFEITSASTQQYCYEEAIKLMPEKAILSTSHDNFKLLCDEDLSPLTIETDFDGALCESWIQSFHYLIEFLNENTDQWEFFAESDGGAAISFPNVDTPGKYRTITTVNHPDYPSCVAYGYYTLKLSSMLVEATTTPSSCSGGDNGQVELMITGGFAPYETHYTRMGENTSFLYNDLDNNEGAILSVNLAPGSYFVEVYDQKCYKNDPYYLEFTIEEPPSLGRIVLSSSGCDLSASIVGVGGTPDYQICWYQRYTKTEMHFDISGNPMLVPVELTSEVDCHEAQVIGGDLYAEAPFELEQGTHYHAVVTDANGCSVTSLEEYITPHQGTRTHNICMRWRSGIIYTPQEHHEPDDKLLGESLNMQKAIEDEIEACKLVAEQAAAVDVREKCQDVYTLQDTMYLEYPLHQQHYTLYYYDMAGRLTRTVPPNGVNPIPEGSISREVEPVHTYQTTYAYDNFNNVTITETPDGGKSQVIYNLVGQARFSQDANRAEENTATYIKYDALGRSVEGGKVDLNTTYQGYSLPNFASLRSENIVVLDTTSYSTLSVEDRFPTINQTTSEKTTTVYNEASGDVTGQRFLRNRISYSTHETYHGEEVKTYYSYDPHGNVEWVVQDLPGLSGQQKTEYEYNLVNGNINKVIFERGEIGQFIHKYAYDSENRIEKVQTSTDGYNWETEATYDYYQHGPMRRMVLGEDRIQGLDYVYTPQGWLKSINHPSFNTQLDPGEDEAPQDVFSSTLFYHDNDFVHPSDIFGDEEFIKENTNQLYNGNIAAWTTGYSDENEVQKVMAHTYEYDWMNRLKLSTYHYKNSPADNIWQSTTDYLSSYEYDPNGNITQLNRNGYGTYQNMDQLTYHYEAETNKLNHITDGYGSANLGDLSSQAADNYEYDSIGNMIRDESSGVDTIEWNVSGKVARVVKANEEILFTYDAIGNRIKKEYLPTSGEEKTLFYARAADGNTLSTYELTVLDDGSNTTEDLVVKEQSIMGNKRLGLHEPDAKLYYKVTPNNGGVGSGITYLPNTSGVDYRIIGNRKYELGDHLGNVRTVIAAYSEPEGTGQSAPTGQDAVVLSYNNYYPFGWTMPGLNGTGGDYRYGFNGMEKDDKIKGENNSYDFGARIYDSRVGRFLSVDPISYTIYGAGRYMYAMNRPIDGIDKGGFKYESAVRWGRKNLLNNPKMTWSDGATPKFNEYDNMSDSEIASACGQPAYCGQTVAMLLMNGNRKVARYIKKRIGNKKINTNNYVKFGDLANDKATRAENRGHSFLTRHTNNLFKKVEIGDVLLFKPTIKHLNTHVAMVSTDVVYLDNTTVKFKVLSTNSQFDTHTGEGFFGEMEYVMKKGKVRNRANKEVEVWYLHEKIYTHQDGSVEHELQDKEDTIFIRGILQIHEDKIDRSGEGRFDSP